MDCLFCKIIAGEIPSAKVYENDYVYAFRDIQPQAPVHVLIGPKELISSIDEVTPANSDIVRHVAEAIPEVAKALGLENGYRVITNVGEDGCQSVRHLHFHVLSGRDMTWPPG